MSQKTDSVYKESYIYKKSPSGLKGFRKWHKRWVRVDKRAIRYYKNKKDEEPLGTILLRDIVDVEYLPKKRIGCRFDVVAKNLRTYSFHDTSVNEAKQWVNEILRARYDYSKEEKNEGRIKNILDDNDLKFLSNIQKIFFKAKFGDEALLKASPTLVISGTKQVDGRYALVDLGQSEIWKQQGEPGYYLEKNLKKRNEWIVRLDNHSIAKIVNCKKNSPVGGLVNGRGKPVQTVIDNRSQQKNQKEN